MKSKHLGTFFRVFISLIAISLIGYFLRHDLEEAMVILRHDVRWGTFFVAISMYLIAVCLLASRMFFVFRVQEIVMKFREVFYLNLVGLFFNSFLPSAVGGDIAKAYYAYKHSGKKMAATTSVLLDRMMGFAALILMAPTALFFYGYELNEPRITRLIFIVFGVMAFVVFFFASRRFAKRFKFLVEMLPSQKWKNRLVTVYRSIYGYKKHTRMLLFLVFLSFVGQAFFILMNYWAARSLGVNIPLPLFFMLVPIAAIISMIPSIGGLGVREAGVIYLFKRFMPVERALAYSLLLDILVYSFSLLCGILYAFRGGLKANELIDNIEELRDDDQ